MTEEKAPVLKVVEIEGSRCPDCDHFVPEGDDTVTLYECQNDGAIFSQENSADGSSHRCPDCNKFVSFDAGELTVNSISATGSEVSFEATATLNCAECGTELKSGDVSDTKEFDADVLGCRNNGVARRQDPRPCPRRTQVQDRGKAPRPPRRGEFEFVRAEPNVDVGVQPPNQPEQRGHSSAGLLIGVLFVS